MKKFKFILFLIPMFVLAGCNDREDSRPRIPDPVVKILDLTEAPNYRISELGQIKAVQEIELVARAVGTIGELSVSVGDAVTNGQTIAVIDFDESNNTARVNYDNAQIQLSNAQMNYNRVVANSQDTITRSGLRLRTLEETLGRLQRNLSELYVTNESTQKTLELQLENAEKNADTAQINLDNLNAQFDQSWIDLLNSTENSLNGVFINIESNFDSIENIINPDKRGYFTNSALNSGLGAAKSSTRNVVVNKYNLMLNSVSASKLIFLSYTPVDEATVSSAISEVRATTDEMRLFADDVRILLNNSISNSQLSSVDLANYKASVTILEPTIIADLAILNGLEKALTSFKLDRISQIATAENNRIIAGNQLADANNTLIQFATTSRGSLQDLKSQIVSTQNDILSSQVDFSSAQRSAGITNSSSGLEIATLENQLRLAEKSLTDNEVKSSINGVLSEFVVDSGDYVTTGTYLGKVIQHESVKVIFYLSEDNAERLNLGQLFNFIVEEDSDKKYTGIISKISPAADPINKKIRIEGSIENKDFFLKPEMYVNLELDISRETFDPTKVYAPMNSIIFNQNEKYVYLIENGQAIRRSIEIGNIFGVWVEIVSGLTKNDVLVIEGQRNLPSEGGVSVRIAE